MQSVLVFLSFSLVVNVRKNSYLTCALDSDGEFALMSSTGTGTCAAHQRKLTIAIKRARQVAILPYVND